MTPSGTSGAVIYLGKSCDAFVTGVGAGKWGWANGGVLVLVDDTNYPFSRQEVPCEGHPVYQALLQCTPVPFE